MGRGAAEDPGTCEGTDSSSSLSSQPCGLSSPPCADSATAATTTAAAVAAAARQALHARVNPAYHLDRQASLLSTQSSCSDTPLSTPIKRMSAYAAEVAEAEGGEQQRRKLVAEPERAAAAATATATAATAPSAAQADTRGLSEPPQPDHACIGTGQPSSGSVGCSRGGDAGQVAAGVRKKKAEGGFEYEVSWLGLPSIKWNKCVRGGAGKTLGGGGAGGQNPRPLEHKNI